MFLNRMTGLQIYLYSLQNRQREIFLLFETGPRLLPWEWTHMNFWNPSSVLLQSTDLLRTGISWFILQHPKDFQQFFKICCWWLVRKGLVCSLRGPHFYVAYLFYRWRVCSELYHKGSYKGLKMWIFRGIFLWSSRFGNWLPIPHPPVEID